MRRIKLKTIHAFIGKIGIAFYFLASLWFLKRRAKFIDKEEFIKAGASKWPKPEIK